MEPWSVFLPGPDRVHPMGFLRCVCTLRTQRLEDGHIFPRRVVRLIRQSVAPQLCLDQRGFDMQTRQGNKGEGWCGNMWQILNNTLNVVTIGGWWVSGGLSLRRNQRFANANRGLPGGATHPHPTFREGVGALWGWDARGPP